ncbi:MAG TPA: tripartite tricarboxylate transporter substrate binding protein [Xanthobacteraceae bacterium]|nr:tripartite tricarboxylate transporter substrate binding protein [Xanthobacteraceae bacterium]
MRLKLQGIIAAACALIVVLGAALAGASSAAAQEKWPTRPVRFIVPLGAGSGADIGARLLADRLSQRWGQPVIVDNRPGGDALVSINAFVMAHDDHVLWFGPSGSFISHPYQHDNLPYKPSDLVPITRISNTIIVVAVPTELHVNTMKDLVTLAQSEPGKLNWAGVTGTNDFMFGGWLTLEHLDMTKVPYKNPVDAAKDLGENRVQVYLPALAIVRPQLDSGKIKLLAVTNTSRAPARPDLPTVKEAGYPALSLDGLVGLFGPPGMSDELRQRITADIRAVTDDTIKERLTQTGQTPNIGGPAEFAKSIEEQRATVASMAKVLGVKPLQ